jgi:hypothetical protein
MYYGESCGRSERGFRSAGFQSTIVAFRLTLSAGIVLDMQWPTSRSLTLVLQAAFSYRGRPVDGGHTV